MEGRVLKIAKDITGMRFGRLIAVTLMNPLPNSNGLLWMCKCDCGRYKAVRVGKLREGKTRSCGCLRRELLVARMTTHGATVGGARRLYDRWRIMHARCENPATRGYEGYGGRGIKVCKRWFNYWNFVKDMGMPPTWQHQIDRKNNDGNYTPKNCRWVTPKQQYQNRRPDKRWLMIEKNGKTQCLKNWCRELGLDYMATWKRYRTLPAEGAPAWKGIF